MASSEKVERPEKVVQILQRGRVTISIRETKYINGSYRWKFTLWEKGEISAYEILPELLRDYDQVTDTIAILRDVQEWLAARRRSLKKEREIAQEPTLIPPPFARQALRRRTLNPRESVEDIFNRTDPTRRHHVRKERPEVERPTSTLIVDASRGKKRGIQITRE